MAWRHFGKFSWAAGVALSYAVLVLVAYAIGPASPAQSTSSAQSIGRACLFEGSGSGPTAAGDSMHFNVVAIGPFRGVAFTDKGPASPLRLRDVHISKVSCNANATESTTIGTTRLAGRSAKALGFRIDLAIQGETGASANFRLRLADGYDSGLESLSVANVTIENHGLKRKALVKPADSA